MILIAASAPFVCLAAPGGAAEAPPIRDSVQGTATHLGADPPFPRITVRIQASSDADGSNPRGVLTVRSSDIGQRRRGEVTCLNVQGNMATIGIKIVRAEDPAVVGMGELWNVVDNGADGDQIAGYPYTASAPTVCPLQSFSVPVVSGNYRISG
ncbi:MAG: hypothetical protein M3Q30_14055 [Actinomycetota bacterium]|nr:hypothetical protein [Actinomycetota bacterium]